MHAWAGPPSLSALRLNSLPAELQPYAWCRLAVFQALHGLAPDIDVRCSNKGLGGVHEPFQAMLKKMEHSQFCLALPGDSPSTRRLSEIFMAGAGPACCAG